MGRNTKSHEDLDRHEISVSNVNETLESDGDVDGRGSILSSDSDVEGHGRELNVNEAAEADVENPQGVHTSVD